MAKNSFNSISLSDNILSVNGIGYPLDTVSTPTVSVSNSSFVGVGCTDNGNGTCTLVVNGQEITVNGEEYTPPITPYLTFSSPNTFTLNIKNNQKYWDGALQYSTNTTTWNTWDGATTLSSSSSGTTNYLYLRGIGNTYITGSSDSFTRWVLTGNNISCDGNIETLLDYATVMNGQHPPMANCCYDSMFQYCESLITAPSLPATTLAQDCYKHMFAGCSSLATAPSLPATTLAETCYECMFQDCTSLTTTPSLPATTLAPGCYRGMFMRCTSLTTTPSLPATILVESCYESMFVSCTSLITASSLPATTALPYSCYGYMFDKCTALTTPAVMGDGTTQLTAGSHCCQYMYSGCTALNLYTTSTNHTPFYKAMTYSTASGATDYYSTFMMFYQCKIDGTQSSQMYITAGTQLYY